VGWAVGRPPNPVGEPDAGKLHVRFDEREVETGQGELLGHRQPKGPANLQGFPTLPRHLPTLLIGPPNGPPDELTPLSTDYSMPR
jgi:hypothetical protein